MKIEIDKPVVPKWFDEWYKTFNDGGNKARALYYLNRTGWGHALTDGNEREVVGYYDRLEDLLGDYGYENAKEYLSKAIIVGYEVEQEPRYYAKIKGWELIDDERDIMYWMIDKQDNVLFVSERPEFSFGLTGDYGYTTELTANQWNELGVYDDVNAVFIPKEEE